MFVIRSGSDTCDMASGKAFGKVTKLFQDHVALDRVHRGSSDASKMMRSSELIQTVSFPQNPLHLPTFAIILCIVSNYSPAYHIKQYQCFWYVRTICELAAELFNGVVVNGPDYNKMGKWHTISFPFLSRQAALKIKFETEIEEESRAWQKASPLPFRYFSWWSNINL